MKNFLAHFSSVKPMSVLKKDFKIALIQMRVGKNKAENFASAKSLVKEASINNADLVVLPECFNSPYGIAHFREYSELEKGETFDFLSKTAARYKVTLIGGSIPEKEVSDVTTYFNTSFSFDREGNFIGKYRKMHLFDISIPNKISFKESEVLSPGHCPTILDTEFGKIGIGICYDLRFPELTNFYKKNSCFLTVFPGAFNTITGPLHWDLLLRSRAVDNQMFIAGCAPAVSLDGDYRSYGHSCIINPWGKIMEQAKSDQMIVYSRISNFF